MPFSVTEDAGTRFQPDGEIAPGMQGPVIRENVDAGTDVIDLAAMRRELEANPQARRRS